MTSPSQLNVIFDFDGTLVDSFNTAINKLALLADEFHFRKIELDEVDALKDLSSQELIRYLNISLFKLPRILRRSREYMHQDISHVPIFKNLPEVLSELHRLNCRLGILTSNSEENVNFWLNQYKIKDLFDFIYADSSFFGKKHILKKIVKAHHMDSSLTFYVGDETRDIEAAKKCKIQSIGVSWGFNSIQALNYFEPNHIVETPHAILSIIQSKLNLSAS